MADLTPLTAEEIAEVRDAAIATRDRGIQFACVTPDTVLRLCAAAESAAATDAEIAVLRSTLAQPGWQLPTVIAGLSWDGHNIIGDPESIRVVRDALHDAGNVRQVWQPELIAMRQRAEKAEADARLLDWHAEHPLTVVQMTGYGIPDGAVRWGYYAAGGEWREDDTLREAIRGAIAASQPAAEGGTGG